MGAVWPPDLPQAPQRGGYSEKYPNQLLRSDMDTGAAKVRRRGTSKPHNLTVKYVMYEDELELFKLFVSEALQEGAICFDWPHPVLRRYVRARMVGGQDSLFTESPFGDTLCFEINFILEFWPHAPLT